MIIVKLNGGLGSQMFQYAMAKRVAINNDTELMIDTSLFGNIPGETPREFELNVFNIKAKTINLKKTEALMPRGLLYIYDKFIPYNKKTFIKQHGSNFDPNMLKVGNNKIIQGYWNSWKYFQDIENIIKKEYELKEGPDKLNSRYIKDIKKSDSISIHVRRGDYVTNAKASAHHGTCSVNYYKKAIKLVEKKIKSPVFFVFSDDLDWVKKNIPIKHKSIYIGNNSKKSQEDLRLMSLCKHNIVANSTFSWWGAWLNKNESKLVYAPQKWFLAKGRKIDDIVPPNWGKIEN